MTYDVHTPTSDGMVKVEQAEDYQAAVLLRERRLAELSPADQLTAKILGTGPYIQVSELPK